MSVKKDVSLQCRTWCSGSQRGCRDGTKSPYCGSHGVVAVGEGGLGGDEADDGSRREDYGATFSAAWFLENKWMPFFRAGTSKGRAALYENSVSAGIGYFARNTDLAGLGLNWAEADGISGDQKTIEAFYRFSISPNLQITPSVQYIRDPLLNTSASSITIWGLRARIVF